VQGGRARCKAGRNKRRTRGVPAPWLLGGGLTGDLGEVHNVIY